MESLTLEQKQQLFTEFFRIKHNIRVNLDMLDANTVLPDADQLQHRMPYAFRIASELSSIESQALRPLRNLGEHANELAQFLTHQSRKIDLMMSLILQQQDEQDKRYQSVEFGGGGVVIASDKALEIGALAEVKLFLEDEAAAVFCYAEVISCIQQDEQFNVSLVFVRIREEDQELLVRATLHLQTQQLKKRQQKEN